MVGLRPPAIHLPPSVDIGAGIERVFQEILQGRSGGPTPDQLPFARSLPHPHSQPDVVARQRAQQATQRPPLRELREDEPHDGLHLLVRVALDGPVSIPHIANGERKGQRAPAGFAQAALVEPLLEQMQLGLTHGPL
jgi:hypothetical protein